MLLRALHKALECGLHVERRFEPWFRPQVDALVREPLAKAIQALINRRRVYEGLGLAEEKLLPGEEKFTQEIIDRMAARCATILSRFAMSGAATPTALSAGCSRFATMCRDDPRRGAHVQRSTGDD